MYDLQNSASGTREAAKQMRTRIHKAVRGIGYKAAGTGRLTPPMYDLRWTMDDCDVRARCAAGSGMSCIPHAKEWDG